MDHLLGEAIVSMPVLAMTRSLAATYNFLFLASFALSGWAVYRLTRLLGVSRWGAGLAGFLYAFAPYRYANLEVLNQLQTQFLPLGVFFGIRYLKRYRARDLAGMAAVLAVQIWFGWYYACYLALVLVILLLYAAYWGSFDLQRVSLRQTLLAGGGWLLAILPVVIPYSRERLLLPEFRRTLGECALYSADLLDYLKLSARALLVKWAGLPAGIQSYCPGFVAAVLGGFGMREAFPGKGDPRGRVFVSFFVLLAAAGFVLSLGPIPHVAGTRLWIPLPYAFLYFSFPGFSSMRAPARLAVLVALAFAVLAGLGWDRVMRRFGDRTPRRLVGFGLWTAALAFVWPAPLPMVPLPTPASAPPVYAWLAHRPGREPLLEIPVPANDADESEIHSYRQFCILLHGKPRLDGTSGFVSRRYREFRGTMQRFPERDALRAAAAMGARVVLVHYGDFAAADRRQLEARVRGERSLVPLARFGDDAVYRLEASPS